MTPVRIVIAGAAGRMGCSLVRAVLDDDACCLAGALEAPLHPHLGADAGIVAGAKATDVRICDDARAVLAGADALVDFTIPTVSVGLAAIASEMGVAHVIGTTGFSANDEALICAAAKKTVIVKSGNMSLGVTLLAALVRRAAKSLPDFDVEILEMHHRMKVDAPSGTALLLGRAAAEGRGEALQPETLRAGRQRQKGSVGFASLRGGTVVGEHQVILAGAQERIILGHVAEDRTIFARGAIAAAKWGQSREPGLYGMADVLGIAREPG
jgi:4-hydroxy-tetrahydrodipicolinate reductase